MVRSLEQVTMRKVYLRILPFAALTYFFCYLDRINVGFAALTMNKDIGLDAAIYGMAAGAFFWGYVLFEVPSNIILEKVGARIWIARIMITWGIISGCTAFATGPYSFMAIRFLLGLAEAGIVPRFRALLHLLVPRRATAPASIPGFTLALPIAVATGAPVSTALLGPRRAVGAQGLAGDVHPRGDPDRADRRRGVLLSDRPAGQGALAAARGARVAGQSHHRRAAADRGGSTGSACCARSGTRR